MLPSSESQARSLAQGRERFGMLKSPSPIFPTPGMLGIVMRPGPTASSSQELLRKSYTPGCWETRPVVHVRGYSPPPPLKELPGKPNIFDEDANQEAMSRSHNPNASVCGSPSPITDARFLQTGVYHPSSMSVAKQPPLAKETGPTRLRRTSSAVSVDQPRLQRPNFFSNCGLIVEDIAPATGEVTAKYRCGIELGRGGFAKVFAFTDMATLRVYACKIVNRAKLDGMGEAKVRMEIDIHRRMNHPNILKLFKAFSDDFYHYILLEHCYHKDLMKFSNERPGFSVRELQQIMYQLTSAVEYMHSVNVIHRDIKLGNTMVDFSGNIKVGDFGFASKLHHPAERKIRFCGTPNYMAPEILTCRETRGYGFEVDVWSLGVILFILAFGFAPFESTDLNATYARIRRIDYRLPPQVGALKSCTDLICWMLQKDPKKRPTPTQILNSAFLRDAGFFPAPSPSLIPPRPQYADAAFLDLAASPSPIVACSPHAPTPSAARNRAHREAVKGCEMDCERRSPLVDFFHDNDPFLYLLGSNPTTPAGAYITRPWRRKQPPRPPDVFFRSALFVSKYGHAFILNHFGKEVTALLFNDRSKMLYDHATDTVVYRTRHRRGGMQHREEGAANESLHTFPHATQTLASEFVGVDAEGSGSHQAAAHKKLGITKFLFQHLSKPCSDPNASFVRSTLRSRMIGNEKLFAPSRPPEGGDTPLSVFVREVIMERMSDLSSKFEGSEIYFTLCRFSNLSFQVSIHGSAGCPPDIIPSAETPLALGSSSWNMDLILYAPFHAVAGFETEHVLSFQSFADIREDTKRTPSGRIFFAAGSSSNKMQLKIPLDLLCFIAELLRRVHCPSDIASCFT